MGIPVSFQSQAFWWQSNAWACCCQRRGRLPSPAILAWCGGNRLGGAGPPSRAFWDLSPCPAALPAPCPSPWSQRWARRVCASPSGAWTWTEALPVPQPPFKSSRPWLSATRRGKGTACCGTRGTSASEHPVCALCRCRPISESAPLPRFSLFQLGGRCRTPSFGVLRLLKEVGLLAWLGSWPTEPFKSQTAPAVPAPGR